jgi:hypothetical protein
MKPVWTTAQAIDDRWMRDERLRHDISCPREYQHAGTIVEQAGFVSTDAINPAYSQG